MRSAGAYLLVLFASCSEATDLSEVLKGPEKLIRWGCLELETQGTEDRTMMKPIAPSHDYLETKKKSLYLYVSAKDIEGSPLFKEEEEITPKEAERIVYKGFPLIGSYKVDKVYDDGIVLRPSCIIETKDMPKDWRALPIDKLPPGLRDFLRKAGAPRQLSIPLMAPAEIANSTTGDQVVSVAQEIFFSMSKGEDYAIVQIKSGSWIVSLRWWLNSKVFELNEIARFGIILLLTVSGLVNVGGRRNREEM